MLKPPVKGIDSAEFERAGTGLGDADGAANDGTDREIDRRAGAVPDDEGASGAAEFERRHADRRLSRSSGGTVGHVASERQRA